MASIDQAHSQDPRSIQVDDKDTPYELHYAKKMSHYLDLRDAEASEVLRLAIRSQHLRRWEVARDSYPMTKAGYYSWRTFLKKRQGEIAAQICVESGYSEEDADRVAALVRKEDLKSDAETQVLEDVACLVFLDDQFDEFKDGYEEEKIIRIVQKTWVKMSEKGHELALGIPMTAKSKALIEKALTAGSTPA
jgi:hypothetical protein